LLELRVYSFNRKMLRKPSYLFTLILLGISSFAFSQTLDVNLDWEKNENVKPDPELSGTQILTPFWCAECKESIQEKYIVPYLVKQIPAQGLSFSNINITNVVTESSNSKRLQPYLTSNFDIEHSYSYVKGQKVLNIKIIPIRNTSLGTELIKSCTLSFNSTSQKEVSTSLKNKKDQTYQSVLSSGDIYKVSMIGDGIYKIDQAFLSQNNIDISSLTMSSFKIYGNGGAMLPEPMSINRPEDLVENAIFAHDENGNDKLDGNDYFLWYAKGPTDIYYNLGSHRYEAKGHHFDTKASYFLTWGGSPGKRISSSPSNQGTSIDQTVNDYDYIIFHESNEENHIKSGRRWWGDKMQNTLTKTFEYNVPGIVTGLANFITVTGVRSLNSSSISLTVAGNSPTTISHGSVSGEYDQPFIPGPITTPRSYNISSDVFSIEYTYNQTLNESAAWIDYFLFTPKRELKAFDDQQIIKLNLAENTGNIAYDFENISASHEVWNITEATSPSVQNLYANGSKSSCIVENVVAGNAPEYILFNKSKAYLPNFIGKVENQNLHSIELVDYLIITNQSLLSQAERLADFHRTYSGLEVEVVTTEQVFNEFSSGSQDVTGIRDFVKLIYDRGNTSGYELKYLLLFGDASYDYKDVEQNNTNVVPIYQSENSHNPPYSYCSDDYYAILDDNEGLWGINNKDEGLDIGVGRLPVSNIDEATIVVDKILHYHNETSLGNWVQTLTFVGDDEDGNDHVGPSESMTTVIRNQYPEFNIKKIWLDAYEQVSFGSGNKYPKVNEEINKALNSQGTLIFNYVGHGGENGMAHERVVTRPEISSWSNKDKLSFYITASCELAKIDNLDIESPGELMLLNPNGGAIGMVATTRVVYIGTNTDLNFEIINNNLFESNNNQLPALGNVYKNTRNSDPFEEINKRCFMLLGDPAMSLHYPKYNVVTTKINGKEIGNFNDTLKALGLVTIEGEIRDYSNNLLDDFNGTLYPTFYDKFSTYKTLGNDPRSIPIQFEMQDRVIYKGQASVTSGKFSFQFVVPKDIAYNVGLGKLSYYAKDGLDHAGGSELSYKIGGTSDSIKNDKTPPTLNLFVDDRSWVFGGTTSKTPLLLADVYDENGINTIGSGIGREMEAILDEGTEFEESLILNDYYSPELNSYQKGIIEYPFGELSPGLHTITLKVWDVYNNSAEDYTEFVVSEGGDIVIDNVLNYPNPFNKYTEFHFDHNKSGQKLKVNLIISSIAGNVVKSITTEIGNAPAHINAPSQVLEELTWDGRDQFGDRIARGVYLYTIKVEAEDGSTHKETQKLFIIN
jgi:hypothetical protein